MIIVRVYKGVQIVLWCNWIAPFTTDEKVRVQILMELQLVSLVVEAGGSAKLTELVRFQH